MVRLRLHHFEISSRKNICELLTRKLSQRVNLRNAVVVVEFKRCRFSARMLNISKVDIASEHRPSEYCSFSCKSVILFKTRLVKTRSNIMNVHELSISKANSHYGCQYRSFKASLENLALYRRNDSCVILDSILVLYTRSFCGFGREKVDNDRRHGQCPANGYNGRDLLHSLWLCIDLCFFNDFFCVAKDIKRISINVGKHVVIRSFISYLVEATIGSARPRMTTISDSVLALVGDEVCETSGGASFFVSGWGCVECTESDAWHGLHFFRFSLMIQWVDYARTGIQEWSNWIYFIVN